MLKAILGGLRAVAGTVSSVLFRTQPVNVNSLSKLNIASLVAQAAFALKNGNPKRALVFLGAASVAPKSAGLSYLLQGAVFANDVRKRLA